MRQRLAAAPAVPEAGCAVPCTHVSSAAVVTAIQVRSLPVAQTRALRRSVLRPHQSIEEMRETEPQGAHAVGVIDGDELIATGLIAPDPARGYGLWRVRGMATKPRARGRGAGTAVLDALLEHARAQGASRGWCNVRTNACSLYERAGFKTVSEEFELPGIGPHVVMELAFSSTAHTAAHGSVSLST